MFKMSATGRDVCVRTFAKVVYSAVHRCLRQVIPDLLQCTFLLRNTREWSWASSEVCEMPEALHPTLTVKSVEVW